MKERITREAILEAIAAQRCPWCGAGPFRMLPVHTNKVHGIDKWELRELAGLKTKDPLCDPDVLAKFSEAALRHPENHAKATEAARQQRRPQRWTSAGLDQQRTTLRDWEESNPEQAQQARKEAARSVTPEGRERVRQGARSWAAKNPKTADDIAAFVARTQTPEAKAKAASKRTLQPHGTRAAYRRGCRCDGCVEANRAYKREHR